MYSAQVYDAGDQSGASALDNLQFYSSGYDESGYLDQSQQYVASDHLSSPSSGSNAYYADPSQQHSYGSPHQQQQQQQQQQPVPVSFWAAFGSGGLPGEPPLLEELGVNFGHIWDKSMAVLHPTRIISRNIMDDTDLAGPLVFYLLFGTFLLVTGKVHFGYIYGVALFGCVAMYTVLNLMSESGIDWARTASVLGYCMLPMVMLSGIHALMAGLGIQLVNITGLIAAAGCVLWCTNSAAAMFVSVLSMSEQRVLVAYPVMLLYSSFALMTVL